MPTRFHGFNVERPSSTRVEIPMPLGDDPARHGLISEYKPNLIDKIGNLVPDRGVGGVLKGLYSGTDSNLFGLLPSGNYETVSPEADLGKAISVIADPIAGLKGIKQAGKGLKHAVSGGTPLSRLLANSIKPKGYSNKWQEVKRVLTNKKAFKEAVIDDIPQYELGYGNEDRLYAWRTKFGLEKPNFKYNQNIDMVRHSQYKIDKAKLTKPDFTGFNIKTYEIRADGKKIYEDSGEILKRVRDYEQNTPIDRLWNKFGTHMEGGKKYHHYKDPKDYFAKRYEINTGEIYKHKLFGGYHKYNKLSGSKQSGGVLRESYYDNWDFGFNKPLKKGNYNFSNNKKHGWPVLVQRSLAEALLKPLEFKGTAKKIFKRPTEAQSNASGVVKDYFNTLLK